MTTLANILSESRQLVDLLIETGGELTPEVEAQMCIIQAQLVEKVDSYFHVLEGLENTAEDLKAKAKMFSNAAKALESAADRLRDHAKQTMVMTNTERITGELIEFSLRSCKKSLKINIDELPEEFIKFVPTPDKEAIEDAVKRCYPVMGVSLEGGVALHIGVPKKMKEAKKK